MKEFQLPMGFGMALVQNERAMAKFEKMTDDEKEAFLERTHSVRSKSEMRSLVNELVNGPEN